MTHACFFRYAWIAPAAFERVIADDGAVEGLRDALAKVVRVAAAMDGRGQRSHAVARLLAFAAHPRVETLPGPGFLAKAQRWAARHGDAEAARLIAACLVLAQRFAAFGSEEADDARDLAVLTQLAATDFPVLLLWSNPPLARKLFAVAAGKVTVAAAIAGNGRSRRRAAATALAYAFGAFGRFGPRDAWVGAGFARLSEAAPPGVLAREAERLVIEPDIAWFHRHWFAGAADRVEPGETAWQHLRRRLAGDRARGRVLDTLERLAAAAERGAWSFEQVDGFLGASAALLAAGAGQERWREDPHRWWLTRIVAEELELPDALSAIADASCSATIAAWRRRTADPLAGPRAPYPIRLAAEDPAALLLRGEELADWMFERDAVSRRRGPVLPLSGAGALVVQIDAARARYRFHEPNVLRSADFVARHFGADILYAGADPARSIEPPPLVDQRLLRPRRPEAPLHALAGGEDAMFRSVLMTAPTAPAIARELASPRYAAAGDLLPRLFDSEQSVDTGFGRIDQGSRIWLIERADARRLAATARTPSRLAAIYALAIDPLLGGAPWIDVLLAGKASRMPTRATAAFRWLLHALRITPGTIAIAADGERCERAPLRDENGEAAAFEAYIVQVASAGTGLGQNRSGSAARSPKRG